MNSYNLPDTQSSPLLRTMNYILDTVDTTGAWGGDDFEDWKPTITALTVDLLLRAGFTPDTEWTIVEHTRIRHVILSTSLQFLNDSIDKSGKFGEDIWDAARFGKIIEEYELQERVSNYSNLKKYILNYVEKNLYRNCDHTWAGPGTMSALIDYLDAINESEHARNVFGELLALQHEDGSFHGPVNEVNEEFVHPIWHTTQVLMTSLNRIPSQKDPKIIKMVDWICNSQDKNKGCWRAFSRFDIYFTSYAIIALNRLPNKPTDIIRNAVEWLCSQASDKGKIKDAGGTIMGALALCSQYGEHLEFRANIADLRRLHNAEHVSDELNDKISLLTTELSSVKNELSVYQRKFNKADICLSKKEAFLFSILLAVVSICVSILPGILSKSNTSPASVPSNTSAVQPNMNNTTNASVNNQQNQSHGTTLHEKHSTANTK